METALSVIGLLAYFLVFGRLRRRTRLNELMLACAIAVLALSNLFLVTVPAVAGWAPDDLTVWGAPVAGSFGALLFVLAAWAAGPPIAAVRAAARGGLGWRDSSAAADHGPRPRARSLVAASGGGFPGARLVRPARHAAASGAVRPATRDGGAVRCGRRRVPAAFPAGPRRVPRLACRCRRAGCGSRKSTICWTP